MGKGEQTTVWFDALHARRQKWLRLGTLADELPKRMGFSKERLREIAEALPLSGRQGV